MTLPVHHTPLGPLTLTGGPEGLTELRFGAPTEADACPPALLAEAAAQLDAYFAGDLRAFDLPLDLRGTPFQLDVWRRLLAIPAGETTTYAAIARALGRPRSVRAVGAAVGRTPIPIVVPCHRVLGADGGLTGYVGGLDRKRALLDHERAA